MTLTRSRPGTPVPTRLAGPLVRVHVVILADRDGPTLTILLDAVSAQTRRPDRVVVVDRIGEPDLSDTLRRWHERAGEHTPSPDLVLGRRNWGQRADLFRTIMESVLPDGDDAAPDPAPESEPPSLPEGSAADGEPAGTVTEVPTDVVWVLPTGVLPDPTALERLTAAWRRSPSVGIVGPKHVDLDDPTVLRSLGIFATRTGRVLAQPPEGEPDQGQYDRRTDVLAVPLAGALIERDLIVRLGGWEPSFGVPGADLDFSWRSHAVGRRVVVVPSARVRSTGDAGRAVPGGAAERRAARRVALTRCAWWTAPFFALWVGLSGLVAAVALALLKRPGAAVRELGDVGAVEPFRPLLSRYRTRGRRTVRRRHLGSLFVPGASVARRVTDGLHDAVALPGHDPERTDVEIAPRSMLGRALRNPGVLAVLAALVAVGIAGRSLGVGLLRGIGGGVTGGEIVGARTTSASLWHGYLDAWHGSGLGGTAPASPSLAALAPPAWLLEHLPLVTVASPGGATVALTLVLALPAAAASAYLALRVLTRNPWLRGVGALAWATTGAATASVAEGRLGAAVALVLLPAAAAGLVRMSVRDGSATAAFATALVATVLGAFAPALLVLVMAIALVALIGGARVRALPVLALPPVLLGPWVLDAVHDPRLLLTGPGLSQWGGTTPSSWQLALFHTDGAGSLPWWAAVPLVVAGVAGLVRARSHIAAWSLATVGVLSLALVLAAPRVRLGTVPIGVEGAGGAVSPWPGIFLLPFALVLVAAAVYGLADAPLRRSAAGWSAVARWPVLGALVLAAVGGSGVLGWATFGDVLHPWSDPRLEAGIDQAMSDPAGRSVFVTVGTAGAAYRVVGRETDGPARILPAVGADADSIAPAVAGILDGSPGQWDTALADRAIGLVGLRDGAPAEVARRLDSTEGLTRLGSRGGWSYWRVRAAGTGEQRPATPPRLRLDDKSRSTMVPTTGENAATSAPVSVAAGTTLVVAQPRGWARYATVAVDGRPLTLLPGDGQPTYAVPQGAGTLTVTLAVGPPWWRLLQGVVLVVLVFLAIPFGRRETRGTG